MFIVRRLSRQLKTIDPRVSEYLCNSASFAQTTGLPRVNLILVLLVIKVILMSFYPFYWIVRYALVLGK